jgi:hypothetical protein
MPLPEPVGPELAAVEPVAPIGPLAGLLPGDFLLGRAHGFKHGLLRFGQGLRMSRRQRKFARYTHAALVVSESGDLIEAVGTGVRRSHVRRYIDEGEPFQIVRIKVSDEDRRQMVDFAVAALEHKAPYGFLANISTALWAFTGSHLIFFSDGSYTCSGLVAAALERTSTRFTTNAARVMPAQLAAMFGAPVPPPDPRGSFGGAVAALMHRERRKSAGGARRVRSRR